MAPCNSLVACELLELRPSALQPVLRQHTEEEEVVGARNAQQHPLRGPQALSALVIRDPLSRCFHAKSLMMGFVRGLLSL